MKKDQILFLLLLVSDLVDLETAVSIVKQELKDHPEKLELEKQTLAKYGKLFAYDNLDNITAEQFQEFCDLKNNHHWTISRHKTNLTQDMPKLRKSLKILLDETIPIANRLKRLRDENNPDYQKYLGEAYFSPILLVAHPDKYPVYNGTVKEAFNKMPLPKITSRDIWNRYLEIQTIILGMSQSYDLSLWQMDWVWWKALGAKSYEELLTFIRDEMVMVENYQPIVLKKILLSGSVSRNEIEEVLKKYNPDSESKSMTNTVLQVLQDEKHPIIRRQDNEYVINSFDELTSSKIDELVRACDNRLAEFNESKTTTQSEKRALYVTNNFSWMLEEFCDIVKNKGKAYYAVGNWNPTSILSSEYPLHMYIQSKGNIVAIFTVSKILNKTDFDKIENKMSYRITQKPDDYDLPTSAFLELTQTKILENPFPIGNLKQFNNNKKVDYYPQRIGYVVDIGIPSEQNSNDELRFFIALGPWSNWEHTIKNPPFRWGVNPSSASNVGVFDALRPGDVVFYYANQDKPTPFSKRGLFGVGKVTRKYDEDSERYWPDEKLKDEIIYKHRFEIESLKLVQTDDEILPWIDGLPFTKGLNRIANKDTLKKLIENTEQLWNINLNSSEKYYIITQNEGSKYDDIPGVQYAYDSDKANYKNFVEGTNFIVQSKINNQNYFVGYGKVGDIITHEPRTKENGRQITDIIAKFSEYHEFPEKKIRTDEINEKMLKLAFPSGTPNIPPAMLPVTKELYDEIVGNELETNPESEKPYSFEEFENFLNQILELDMYGHDTTGKPPKLDVKTLQLFFKITYYCALKVTEVIELRKNDFDIENRILTVNDSKAGKSGNQMTTIPPPIINELKPFLNSLKDNEKLFNMSRQNIWQLTNKIVEKIDKTGNRRITPENFRQSYAEFMAIKKADHNLITLKLRNAFPSNTYGTLPTLNDLKKWEERIFEESNQNNLKSFKNSKLIFPPNLNEAKNEIQKHLLIPGDVIERIIFSLYSEKHVILTGPVGTGKTHLAKLIPKIAWSKIGGYYPETVTATSEWTTQDVVGGIFPKINGDQVKYSIQKGCVSDSISKNWLDESGKSNERIKFKKEGVEYNGVWLVIDEFNRANIDRAFGPLFTALEYKKLQIPTTKPDESYEELTIPEDYRIIGTLNTFDKHFLFRLSDALKRRFSFIEILPPTYDKIIEEIRFVSDKALENYDEIKQELKIQNFDDLRKNTEVYSLLTNLYEIMAFVRLSKNLGTAVLISMFRFALINYQQTKNLDNSLDAAVLTHLLPHLESLQYWQIDSIMNFVGGRIHEMFRKFDVNKRPDVDRYEEELRNLTKYLRVSGTNKSAGNWIAKFRTGEIFKLSTPISDLDPWNNKKRPVLQRFREALESLKKEKGYFEEAEGLNE